MYDIKKESKDKSVFRKKILNHGQLYFIDIYSDRIVYDHYYPDVTDSIITQSIQIFLFTFNSNGRYEERKNENNKTEDTGMYIEEDSKLYQCAYGSCFSVNKVRIIDTINNEISNLVAFI